MLQSHKIIKDLIDFIGHSVPTFYPMLTQSVNISDFFLHLPYYRGHGFWKQPWNCFCLPCGGSSPFPRLRYICSPAPTHSLKTLNSTFFPHGCSVAENTPLISLVFHSLAVVFFFFLKLFLKGSKIISFLSIFRYILKEMD